MPLPIKELPPAAALAQLADSGDISGVTLILTVFLTARDLYASTERFFSGFGISDAKWSVLMLLATAPDKRLAPSQIAQRLKVTRATVSGVLKGLERAKLVVRAAHPGDGRVDSIRLGSGGERLLRRMMPALAQRHAASTADLSLDERRTLIELLRRLRVCD